MPDQRFKFQRVWTLTGFSFDNLHLSWIMKLHAACLARGEQEEQPYTPYTICHKAFEEHPPCIGRSPLVHPQYAESDPASHQWLAGFVSTHQQ